MIEATQVKCGKCAQPLPESFLNSGTLAVCPNCHRKSRVELFPAYFSDNLVPTTNVALLDDSEAGCFYHPKKKAAVICDSCGRFICGLCDVELEGRHLCPGCLATGQKKKKIRNLENERMLYDNMACSLSILALLAWPITLLSAPASLYLIVKHWKSPGSIIPRTKFRFIIAAIFALAEVAGWIFLFAWLITKK